MKIFVSYELILSFSLLLFQYAFFLFFSFFIFYFKSNKKIFLSSYLINDDLKMENLEFLVLHFFATSISIFIYLYTHLHPYQYFIFSPRFMDAAFIQLRNTFETCISLLSTSYPTHFLSFSLSLSTRSFSRSTPIVRGTSIYPEYF